MTTTYVIADLHGRDDLLETALDLIEARGAGRLIVLGDFVDRGPGSRQIVERLLAGPPPGWGWTVLRGNHEEMMLQVCGGRWTALDHWIGNGGDATLCSYGVAPGDFRRPAAIPRDHLRWIHDLPLVARDRHRIYVHAGLDHAVPLDAQTGETLLWKRYGAASVAPFEGAHVVHGHDQSARNPRDFGARTCLDAHAWFTGRLAIGVFDDATPGGPIDVLWAEGQSVSWRSLLAS